MRKPEAASDATTQAQDIGSNSSVDKPTSLFGSAARPAFLSSPPENLPPLPRLHRHSESVNPLSSPPQRERDNSGQYYAAAWGSPYATPSPNRSRHYARHSEDPIGGLRDFAFGGYEPGSESQFKKKRPATLGPSTLDPLLGQQIPVAQPSQSSDSHWASVDSNPTSSEELSHPQLSESKSERPNWLSDDSGDNQEPAKQRQQRADSSDSLSKGWLGLDEEQPEEDIAQTPTVKNFVEQKEEARPASRASNPVMHRKTESTVTLKPSDYKPSSPLHSPQSQSRFDQKAEPQASPAKQPAMDSPLEKSFPVASSEEKAGDVVAPSFMAQPALPTRPNIPSAPSFQRPRKRITWRGKACIIALPVEDKREFRNLLTPDDVDAKLKQWEKDGYDTSSLNLGGAEAGSQSRPLFPSVEDIKQERKAKRYNVRIPNRAEWDAYVKAMAEEKLRALGVTFGDEEPPSSKPTPAPPMLSRTASQMSALPISPPLPTSSVTSNPIMQQIVSPSGFGSANGGSQTGSFTSPAPYGGYPPNMHRPGQTVAFDPRSGSPFNLPQMQPTPPAGVPRGASAQGYFANRMGAVSPPTGVAMPNMGELLSPVSPMPAESGPVPSQSAGMLEQMRRHQQEVQAQMLQQQHQQLNFGQPGPMTPLFGQRGSTPEMVHPTPQGHHRNVSEALQREVDAADTLESSIRGQLEGRQKGGKNEKTPLIDDDSQHYDRKEADILKGLDLDQTDEDTNPSLTTSPKVAATSDPFGNFEQSQDRATRPGHKSKLSTSRLNVEAKPFDPTGSFAPSNFSFGGDSFQPVQPPAFKPPVSIFNPNPHGRPLFGSVDSDTPSFVPSNGEKKMPSSDFKFSNASFNVEAPSFTPGGAARSVKSPTPTDANQNKIFGNINIEDIVKPARKSKAIPIVRPDIVESSYSDHEERGQVKDDDFGRPQPAQAKRIRRGRDDGDDELQYAPSSPHLTEIAQNKSPSVHTPKLSTAQAGKENVLPESSVTSPFSPPAPETGTKVVEQASKTDDENAEAESVTDQTGERDIGEAEPSSLFAEEKQESLLHEEAAETSDAEVEPGPQGPRRPSSSHKRNNSSLSATAPAFVPKSGIKVSPKESELIMPTIEADGAPASASDSAQDTPDARKIPGLKASRWAVESSPTLPEVTSDPEPGVQVTEPNAIAEASLETENVQDGTDEGAESASEADQVIDNVKHMDVPSGTNESEADAFGVASPSFEDIDAVMRAMDADPDLGVERRLTPSHGIDSIMHKMTANQQLHPSSHFRSDAPSPSPKRVNPYQDISQMVDTQQELPKTLGLGITAPVNRLNGNDDAQISDWNDALSAEEEEKFTARTTFFDGHVNNLVGGILDDRLAPVERALDVIQESLSLIATKPTNRGLPKDVSYGSDADDEDDEDIPLRPASASYRSRSPLNPARTDRKTEQIKAAVREALISYQPPQLQQPHIDLARVHEVLAEMKLLAEPESLQGRTMEMKRTMEDVISTHPRLSRGSARGTQDFDAKAEKLQLQIDGLESMLKIANERNEEEYKMRREAEAELAAAQAVARHAREEAAEHRESAEEAEKSLRTFVEERNGEPSAQDELENLQQTIDALSLKNSALETTLDEYRISHDQWRDEIDAEKAKVRDLKHTMQAMKRQIDESSESRHALRSKFERLQDDMATAAKDLARDHLVWKRKEEEYIARHEAIRSAFERETQARDNLEVAHANLRQEHDRMLTFQPLYEQSQKEADRLDRLNLSLKDENRNHQETVFRLERELASVRENSTGEMERVQKDLGAEITRLQKQLSDAREDAVATTTRHQTALQELHDSKVRGLQEAAQNREASLEEQHRLHERALNDLRERHGRALHNSSEDRQRGEQHLMDTLALSNDKITHLEDKVSHLQNRLEVAQEAARAAVEAASSNTAGQKEAAASAIPAARVAAVEASGVIKSMPPPTSAMPSMPFAPGTTIPEKISPQALRETIMVLQEQLQNEESTIESLNAELAAIDKSLPTKIKEREIEVTWLRELLAVRIDDLSEIANSLTSGESFNTEAARDAAIRLKANLEMEQQERERLMSGIAPSLSFPSLASISQQLAAASASPRATAQALPMAAAAAWGNWRKGRDFSTSLSDLASSVTATPSRASTSGSLLSGLMTPPATSQSQRMSATPTPTTAPASMTSLSGRRINSEARPLRGYASAQQTRKLSTRSDSGPRPLRRFTPSASSTTAEEPTTPTGPGNLGSGDLLRKASYDDDAETRTIISGFGDEETGSSVDSGSAEKHGRGLRDQIAG